MRRGFTVLLLLAVAAVVLLRLWPASGSGGGAAGAGVTADRQQHGDSAPTGVPAGAEPATVTSITDGDTLRVDTVRGDNEPVRLLQIDTPEVSGDCGADEATDALARLAPVDSRVWLEADAASRDRYGRLLRYLWRDDGTMVNETMLREGWARAVLYEPNDRHWSRMVAAEQHARERDAGLWRQCGWVPDPDTRREGGGTGTADGTPDGRCDPNYTGCVPPYPPDVDCDVVDGPVAVIGSDPHNLDGNHDGQACEPPRR